MSERRVPLSVPNLKGNELKYVSEAVRTEWVSTGGAFVNAFEENVAEYVHAAGAVACQSGTAGLHTALLLAEVTREDAVIVPALTFIAAVNPVKYIDAYPIFMDCDASLCMDAVKLEAYCETRCDFVDGRLIDRKSGRHVKALIVVHVFGNMADMEAICKIARRFHLILIEDATEALGTCYTEGVLKGRFAGTIGDIGVYSFNGNKIITTGGGGMLVSDNTAYLKRARHLTTQAKSDELYYTHDEVGYNYRMTNVQAALGLAQLEQLEDFISIKRENYKSYEQYISELPDMRLLPFRESIRSNYWFYALYVDGGAPRRDEWIHFLAEHGVQTRPIWGLVHEQKPYEGSYAYEIAEAENYWEHVINIPCSTSLTAEDIEYVAGLLRDRRAG